MLDSMAFFASKTDPLKNDLPMPLSSTERAEFAKLEELVSVGIKAFATAGKALARIRDKQLYRESHDSFEQYVADRWSMTRQHAGRLIEAAAVVANLETGGSKTMPLSEYQARQLAPLAPEVQREAWAEVVADAPEGASVSTDAIKAAVSKRTKAKRRKARPKPVRIKVPGAVVTVTPNAKFAGSAADALRAALEKLASEQGDRRAAA